MRLSLVHHSNVPPPGSPHHVSGKTRAKWREWRKKKLYSVYFMFAWLIFPPCLMLNKLPATEARRCGGGDGGVGGGGDSLIRGVNADETYLGRAHVHEAPRLPVLKHRRAERLLRLSFASSKGKEWGWGWGVVLLVFPVGLFCSV